MCRPIAWWGSLNLSEAGADRELRYLPGSRARVAPTGVLAGGPA